MCSIRERLSGNEAVSVAMRQINPDVVAAFPITPSTEIPQYFASFVNDGKVDTVFVTVESEHSALSACIGASAAGARAMTATSSNGLALMWEMVYIASAMRFPIVMPVVNRAVSGPLNIHCDHSDSMGTRDSGWIQIYSENNQEAYDNVLQAVRIAEHSEVMLPVMVCYDGFITSHSVENIELISDDIVKKFVGAYEAKFSLLDKDVPVSHGPLDLPIHFSEHKKQQADAIRRARNIILKIGEEFEEITGRKYEFVEKYKMEDADIAIIVINSTAGTSKFVVDQLRGEGVKAGVVKIRVFRPFPVNEIVETVSNCRAVAVLDKCDSLNGAGGPLFTDVTSALYNKAQIKIVNYIYGLGGRDVRVIDIRAVYDELKAIAEKDGEYSVFNYLNTR